MKTIQMTIDERLLNLVDKLSRAKKTTRSAFIRDAHHRFPFLEYATIVFTSALTGDGVGDIIYFGTLSQVKSTDAGATFVNLTGLHADTHTWGFAQQSGSATGHRARQHVPSTGQQR